MTRDDFRLMAVGHILSDSEELTLKEQLEVMDMEAERDPYVIASNIPGVQVWEVFEAYDVGELIDLVDMHADDLEKCYKKGYQNALEDYSVFDF